MAASIRGLQPEAAWKLGDNVLLLSWVSPTNFVWSQVLVSHRKQKKKWTQKPARTHQATESQEFCSSGCCWVWVRIWGESCVCFLAAPRGGCRSRAPSSSPRAHTGLAGTHGAAGLHTSGSHWESRPCPLKTQEKNFKKYNK